MKNNFKLKNNKLYIHPISDLHLGAKNCNLDFFEQWERVFYETSGKNKLIYVLGDMIDLGSRHIGGFEQSLSGDEQINELIELLEPYKKYIRVFAQGNHAARAKKEFDLSLVHIIGRELGIPTTTNDYFDTIYINGQEFTIYCLHGTTYSKDKHLAIGAFNRQIQNIEYDLAMCGHNHLVEAWSNTRRTKEGIERKYQCFTGHFLKYKGSYANDKMLNHIPEGFVRLNINKFCNVGYDFYNVDEINKKIEASL